MAFPSFVKTRTISLGGAVGLENGQPLSISAVVNSTKGLIWNDTGYRFEQMGVSAASSEGAEVRVTLPVTDQQGWRDPVTNSIIDVSAPGSYTHMYVLTAQVGSSPRISIGPFALPTGDGSDIDLDTMLPASTSVGNYVSVPDMWSARVTEALQAAQAAADSAEEARNAAGNQLDQARIYAVSSARFPAMAPDQGANVDIAPALMELVSTLPAGASVVRFTEPGQYWLKTPINLGNRSVHIDFGRNSDVVVDIPPGTAFTWGSTMGSQRPVTSVTSSMIDVDGVMKSAITVELVNVAPSVWTPGMMVKIISDDLNPDARPGTGGSEGRNGQTFSVHSVSGTTVVMLGVLSDTYTTNIRLSSYGTAISGLSGNIRVSDAAFAEKRRIAIANFIGRLFPVMDDLFINRTLGVALQVTGCYGHYVGNVDVNCARNAPQESVFGYAFLNNSSEGGYISPRYTVRNARHAYTDDVPRTPANSGSTHNYGRPRGDRINGTAYDTTQTAWDTHHGGESHFFESVRAFNCFNGLALRGRKHRIGNVLAVNCTAVGVQIFTEDDGGATYGIESIGTIDIDGCDYGLRFNINPTGHPEANIRDTRISRLASLRVQNFRTSAIDARNATFSVDQLNATPAASVRPSDWKFNPTDVAAVVNVRNCHISIGKHTTDFRENTSGDLIMFRLVNSPFFVSESGLIQLPSSAAARLNYINLSGTQTQPFVILDQKYAGAVPATHIGGTAVKNVTSRYQWSQILGGQQSSSWATITGSNATNATVLADYIGHVVDDSMLRVTMDATSRTLGALPNGNRRGQTLVIFSIPGASLGTLTVKNDTANYNTTTATGADITVAPGRSATFMWTLLGSSSTWMQIA